MVMSFSVIIIEYRLTWLPGTCRITKKQSIVRTSASSQFKEDQAPLLMRLCTGKQDMGEPYIELQVARLRGYLKEKVNLTI